MAIGGSHRPAARDGRLVVDSRHRAHRERAKASSSCSRGPPGARVTVDGNERGVTPLTVRLPSGAHVLEVQIGKSEPRVIPLTIQAGVQTAQYIELQGVAATGALEITQRAIGRARHRSTASRAARRRRPFAISPAGDHTVVLEARRPKSARRP